MANKGVNIKLTADEKPLKNGLDKATSALNKFKKSLSKNSTANFVTSLTGVGKAFGAVTGAAKAAAAVVNETIEAYNKQAEAEVQLEGAARNNPYLNAANVQSLKDYASQLQSMSTFGDEELLPLMAQLASAGRNQAEIQDIMSASVDIAASGTMSLESAVKNLSKTYSGLSGELGEANPAIKALTTEQLKNGDAVKVMKSQYSGIAKSVADATGGWKQFQNTLGDLKEAIGQNFAEGKNSAGKILNNFLSSVVSGLQESNKAAQEFKNKIAGIAAVESGTLTDSQTAQKTADESKARLDNYRQTLKTFNEDVDTYTAGAWKELTLFNAKVADETGQEYDEEYKRLKDNVDRNKQVYTDALTTGSDTTVIVRNLDNALEELAVFEKRYKTEHDRLQKELDDSTADYWKRRQGTTKKFVEQDIAKEEELYSKAQKKADELREQEESAAAAAASKAAQQTANDTALAAMNKYQQTMDALGKKQEDEKHLAEETGDAYDEQAAKVERLNTMVSAYLQARKEAGSTISDNNGWTKQRISDIEELKGEVEDYANELAKAADVEDDFGNIDEFANIKSEISGILGDTNSTVETQIALLESLKEAWSEIPGAVSLVDEAIKSLKSTTEGSKTSFEEWYAEHGDTFQKSEEIVSKMNDAMSEYTSGQIQRYEDEKDAALSNLEEQHDKGLVSDEEYEKQKEKIEKAAAEKEYKLKLAQWASNIATTTGQTAMAVVSALANSGSPYVAIPMAAAIGALGAAQLATLIGSKPTPPSYATGGVVGGFNGATAGGDNTYIHARSGEMMLNAAQQRRLFDFANSKGAQSGMKVNIRNYMGESAEVTPQLSGDTLNLIIDRRVTEQLSAGSYGEALTRSDIKRAGTLISN